MADLGERVAQAREHAKPAWTAERERTVRSRVEARLELGRRRRVVALSFAALALFVGGLFAWHRLGGTGPVLAGAPAPRPAFVSRADLLHFEDGSTVTAITPDARAEPAEVRPTAVTVRLAAGAARFSVTPNPDRVFRVQAGDATITVLGTVFTVAIEERGVRVRVERGRVHLEWPAGERFLAVGEEAQTAESVVPGKPASPETAADAAPAARGERPAAPDARTPSWRALAEEGDYAHALARLTAEGPLAVHDEPGDLLLAADVARLGGHPEKAITPLERVLSAHGTDSRAPLAAFTLGRTLLDQLGRPLEAARAFARARKLDPRGAMAQDALAREVESWSRAGDTRTAADRAEEYVSLYPKGRRLKAVKRLGGLD